MTDACDTVVVVSGDTDLATAIRAAKRLVGHKKIGVGFPYKRFNRELKQISDYSFKIDAQQYLKFPFPPTIVHAGKVLTKPSSW